MASYAFSPVKMKSKLLCFLRFLFLIIPAHSVQSLEKNHPKTSITLAYRGHRLEDCLLRSHYVSYPDDCAQYCLHDAKCQSFNHGSQSGLMQDDLCELNSCTKSVHRDREKFKSDPRFIYYEMIRQTDVKIMNIDHEDNTTKVPMKSNPLNEAAARNGNTVQHSRKCSDFLSSNPGIKSHTTSETYKILDNDGNVIDVWCYLNHNLSRAWTLVMSFSYLNYNETAINGAPLTKNWPIKESFPNLHRYRMSHARMKYIRNHTTSWSTVCNFTGSITDRRDTARARFSEFDPLKFSTSSLNGAEGECKKVAYINIQGETCSDCTSFWVQNYDTIFHARSGKIKNNIDCIFNKKGVLDMSGKFGYYARGSKNSNFGCTKGVNSTTSLWFGE